MSKINFYFIVFAWALTALGLGGCKSEPTPGATKTGDTPMLANPASVYCQGLGYREERRVNEAGEYSACIFPDGTECDS